MNAADDIECLSFHGGHDVGDFCAAVFSGSLALLSEAERDEMDEDREVFASRIEAMFAQAVKERALPAPNPQAFVEGWRQGFKARVEREWPLGDSNLSP